MKAVFDTKPTSIYDDDISEHYQFPRRYLSIAERCVGDWIVMRRPRADGGNLAYFATARIIGIEPDPLDPAMSYARFADFLTFDRPVPWTIEGRYSEADLRNIPQTQVGLFLRGRSVRTLNDEDFLSILAFGFANTFNLTISPLAEFDNNALPDQRVKKVTQMLVNRVIRDANFRLRVYEAYDDTCAITGMRVLDNDGNSEVHAAHILAVKEGGPDIVQNGLALSGTIHLAV